VLQVIPYGVRRAGFFSKREGEVNNGRDKSIWRQLLEASAIPLNLVVATFVGLAIGYFLDRFLGTSPYLTIVFLLLGIIAGFRELFRFARRQQHGNDQENQ
jgi:ATP synthase protein I